MADDEPQPGPSGEKRHRTAKDYPHFVITDAAEVLRLLEDDSFEDWCGENMSDDSFDEDGEGGVAHVGGERDIARLVAENVARKERAELEAEYDSAADSDYNPDHESDTADSTEEEELLIESSDAGDMSQTAQCGRLQVRQRGGRLIARGRGMTHLFSLLCQNSPSAVVACWSFWPCFVALKAMIV